MGLPALPPLHPVLVHIPIVLLPLGALLATIAVARNADWAAKAMVLVLALAAVGAVAAAVAGDRLKDAQHGEARTAGEKATLETHEHLGVTTAVVACVLGLAASWKRDLVLRKPVVVVWLAALWLVALLVLVTSFYGGNLVWAEGA